MNNKGFTLAELLAIVVIIGVIAVISTINMTKQISSSEKEEKNALSQNIENAAKVYAAKYHSKKLIELKNCDLFDDDECQVSISLDDLVKEGLINLKDNQCVGSGDKNIIIHGDMGQKCDVNGENCKDITVIKYNYDQLSNLSNCY